MNTEQKDGVLIAKPEGRIDGVNARDFHEALSEAIGTDSNAVLVDLAAINYISSAGLRTFLLIAKTLQQRSAQFALCSLSEPIREIFEISGFDKIIAIHASEERGTRRTVVIKLKRGTSSRRGRRCPLA